MDATAAKQFLISKVIEQAEIEQTPLSEIERKMLHFTEVHPSLPDIYEINEQFEREYDSDKYEARIVTLLKNARLRDQTQAPGSEQSWAEALDLLKTEDHYILVMAGQAFGWDSVTQRGATGSRPWIYVAIGAGIGLLLVLKQILTR